MESAIRVLLVEDSPGDALLLRSALTSATEYRCKVDLAQTMEHARRRMEAGSLDVVLLDLSLPDSSGMQTVLAVRQCAPDLPVVVLTGLSDESAGVEAIRLGVQDYLIKGQADQRTLARSIRYAIEHKRAQLSLEKARDERRTTRQGRTAELEQTLTALQEEFDERIMLSQAVDANRDILHKVAELIPYGLWIADPAGGLTYLSESFLEMTGLTMEQCRQMAWAQCLPEERRVDLLRDFRQCVENGHMWDRQFEVRGKTAACGPSSAAVCPSATSPAASRPTRASTST